MNLYLLRTAHKLEPFNENLDDLPFGAGTFAAERRRIADRLGLTLKEIEPGALSELQRPCLVIAENCFVSEKALKDFLKGCTSASTVCQLALAQTPSTEYTRPVSSAVMDPLEDSGPGGKPKNAKGAEATATHRVRYSCFFVPKGSPVSSWDDLLNAAQPLVVPKREILIPLQLPLWGAEVDRTFHYPITSTVAAHVDHWVNLLWLNQLAFAVRWNETVRAHPIWALTRIIRAGSIRPEKILPHLNRIGRNCNIHKTAYVEGCIIGDGVTIGAKATVRNSILGDNVKVEDHANVLSSVLSPNVYVTPKTFVIWSLADRGATISNYKLQVSVLGKNAATSTWAGLIDAKLKGDVAVFHQNQKISTERQFLGSCIGHNAYIGAKVLILPGRSVPNDAFVAMQPDELISEVPADLIPGAPYMREGGTLVPVKTK